MDLLEDEAELSDEDKVRGGAILFACTFVMDKIVDIFLGVKDLEEGGGGHRVLLRVAGLTIQQSFLLWVSSQYIHII